jgi:hypothetical protein
MSVVSRLRINLLIFVSPPIFDFSPFMPSYTLEAGGLSDCIRLEEFGALIYHATIYQKPVGNQNDRPRAFFQPRRPRGQS